MPLYRDITIPDKGRLSIWKITENPVFFSEKLHFSYTESEEFNNIKHPNRQLEWLAARWLLHQLTGTNTQRYSIQKDHFGKPSFEDHPMFFSLSHSVNYVAALISEKDCGLDLQLLDERILNVIPKFLSERELTFIFSPAE